MHYAEISKYACERACQAALELLATALPPRMYYHSHYHTVDEVLPQAMHLVSQLDLNTTEIRLLKTAACFHDVGFTEQHAYHEQTSAVIAQRMLPRFGYRSHHIAAISDMIMATEIPQNPTNLPAKILADADLDLFGRPDYLKRNLDLRLELTAVSVHLTDAEWFATQLAFISGHRYFSQPARDQRSAGKRDNIRQLHQILDSLPLPVYASPLPDLRQFGIPVRCHYLH